MFAETAHVIRFQTLMYGMYRAMRFTAAISGPFARRVAEKDLAFLMTSKQGRARRCFRFTGGKISTGTDAVPTDFSLIWLDEKTGGQVMSDLVLGKPKVLANAVAQGKLFLEGDASQVFWFLETVNLMARTYRGPKKKPEKSTS